MAVPPLCNGDTVGLAGVSIVASKRRWARTEIATDVPTSGLSFVEQTWWGFDGFRVRTVALGEKLTAAHVSQRERRANAGEKSQCGSAETVAPRIESNASRRSALIQTGF